MIEKLTKKLTAGFLFKWEIGVSSLFAIIILILFPEHFLKLLLIGTLIAISRSTALFDHLKIEIHAVLTLVVGNIIGFGPAAFIARASTPFVTPLGRKMGAFQKPLWILVDTLYLIALSGIASIIPSQQLAYYGIIAIVLFGNVIVAGFRIWAFKDPIPRRVILGGVNSIVNYLIITNFLPQIIAFVR